MSFRLGGGSDHSCKCNTTHTHTHIVNNNGFLSQINTTLHVVFQAGTDWVDKCFQTIYSWIHE